MGGALQLHKNHCMCILRMTTKDWHVQCLSKICRVCGSCLQCHYKVYSCKDHQAALEATFGIDVITESCDVHVTSTLVVSPPHFSKCCYTILKQSESAMKKSHIHVHVYDHGVSVCCQRQVHDDDSCEVSVL